MNTSPNSSPAAQSANSSAMLYADKAALENRTKLRLLAIRERELTLYTQNCFTIGTISAVMAGLAYSSLLYTKMDYFQNASAFIQTMYVMGNTVCMYLALRAMTGTTMIAMFGPGKAGISFQGCLYSFVFCLLVYAWSEASPTAACVLLITATALFTVYSMIARTNEVETTFPLYSIPLVSGAFFNKKAGSGAASDPAASIQAEAQATDPPSATSTPAAARPPARVAVPPPRSRGGKERSMAGGHEAREAGGTPVLMADRAPALPPAIAARHAEQQRLVAEARVRSVERKAADKEAGSSRQKDGKWFTRLRDR